VAAPLVISSSCAASHGQPFECELVVFRLDDDGLELRIFREEGDDAAGLLIALDRDFVGQAGDHDLAVARLVRAAHRQQVAVEDAGITHGHAAHLQQVVRLGGNMAGSTW
jgi:hypothetical protein